MGHFPDAYQWLVDKVKPVRLQNPRPKYAREWWIHAEPRSRFRSALNLTRFIGTSRTARHRVFLFVDGQTLPETTVLTIAHSDAWVLGVLSSRLHIVFADATGGRLGVGNDSRYQHDSTFNPFPFAACSLAEQQRIREIGEQLDAHRKARQVAHPDLTITGMYNVLEKLRAKADLFDKDRIIHEQGLVSVLKQIHDDLDAAVFDAYGWPHDLTDEQILEKLVALNAERAEEEHNGQIRWLRPDFQNPGGKKASTQETMAGAEGEAEEAEGTATAAQAAWSKKLPEQIAAVRDLVLRGASAWSSKNVAAAFTGVSAKGVEPVLESLAALGLIVGYEAGGERRWRAARAGA